MINERGFSGPFLALVKKELYINPASFSSNYVSIRILLISIFVRKFSQSMHLYPSNWGF